MIEHTLNKRMADDLFAANAVMVDCEDVIFDYIIAELFGIKTCTWAIEHMAANNCMIWKTDWNSWGSAPCHYFHRSGFDKIVSYHNYQISLHQYQNSEGGKIWDSLWQVYRK